MISNNPEWLAWAIVSGIPDAVIYSDAEGIIRYWNGGAERIFGFTPEEAVGQSLDIIIPERLRARHWEGYRRTMATGQSRYGAGDLLAVPALTRSGDTISIEFTVAPIRDDAGSMVGIAAVLRDVTRTFTELKRLRKIAAAARIDNATSGA